MNVGGNWDLKNQLNYERNEDLLKKDLLTIAMNSFGDWFCIELKDGSIWFAYHDKNKNVKIADSFMEFLDNSKSKTIGHIRSIEERKQCLWDNFHKEPSEITLKGWQAEIDKYSNLFQEEVRL